MDEHILGAEELRAQMKRVREAYPHHWVASRKFVTPSSFPATQAKLIQFLPPALSKDPFRLPSPFHPTPESPTQ